MTPGDHDEKPAVSTEPASEPAARARESAGAADFLHHADQAQTGLVRELFAFLRDNKKWWLAPIIIVMLLLAGLVIVAGSGAAPFIYTLF